jgi:hypothetical protein
VKIKSLKNKSFLGTMECISFVVSIFDINITVLLPFAVDLSPEQQKLLIELRRKKQELLLEIQVSQLEKIQHYIMGPSSINYKNS